MDKTRNYLANIIQFLTKMKSQLKEKQERMKQINMSEVQKIWDGMTKLQEVDLSWIADAETLNIVKAEIEGHNQLITEMKDDITGIKTEVVGVRSDIETTNNLIDNILYVLKKQYNLFGPLEIAPENEINNWNYELDSVNNQVILKSTKDTISENVIVYGRYTVGGIEYNTVFDPTYSYVNYKYMPAINNNVKSITFGKNVEVRSLDSLFFNSDITALPVLIFENDINVSKFNKMSKTFYSADELNIIDLSTWKFDTSNVTDMRDMFNDCSKVGTINLGPMDTSNVTNMEGMFNNCRGLSSLDLTSFDTSKVTNMDSMFKNCTHLYDSDKKIENFNVSSVENMDYMLSGSAIQSFDMSKWNPIKLTSISSLFSDCKNLQSVTGLNVLNKSKITNLNGIFRGCSKLESIDLSGLNTENITGINAMFQDCTALTSLDLTSLDFRNVINASYMFKGCTNLTEILVSRDTWLSNTCHVTDMFTNCGVDHVTYDRSKYDIPDGQLGSSEELNKWNYSIDALNEEVILNNYIGSDTDITVYGYYEYDGVQLKTKINNDTSYNGTHLFNRKSDITSITYKNTVDFTDANMSYAIDGLSSLQSINFEDGIDLTKLKSLDNFFYGSGLTTLDLTKFANIPFTSFSHLLYGFSNVIGFENLDFSGTDSLGYLFYYSKDLSDVITSIAQDTSHITDMNNMFYSSKMTKFNFNFDTSNVTDMREMFYDAHFNSYDLSNFDTSNVQFMGNMFHGNNNITTLDLSSFDTSKVTNMANMFSQCRNLTSLDLTSWDTHNVTSMVSMFNGCTNLTEILVSRDKWVIPEGCNTTNMFTNCGVDHVTYAD